MRTPVRQRRAAALDARSAPEGRAPKARINPSPFRFMPFRCAQRRRQDLRLVAHLPYATVITTNQKNISRTARENSDGDDPGDLIDSRFHFQRIGYWQIVNIENVIAIVSYGVFAPYGLPAHL
jgi:hypothetical protein